MLEDWDIWLRWETAHKKRKTLDKTHPALPEERQRHDELATLIGDRLKVDPQHGFSKWARFKAEKVQWVDAPTEPNALPAD
ncbi:hypothetical protein [Bradyrhizobium sp. 930_D9_N1_4]|uniref:hypothetical protein n=1 Tax=Bradyrhizobium sp. 930_D9_N1_4 TaxID=3240374 RepID=UPI003F8A57E5